MDDAFIWVLAEKPKILLDTLHATNRDLYPAIIQHNQYVTNIISVISNKRDIFKWKETSEILLKVAYGR